MGTKFSEWAEGQKASETPGQAELRCRFGAGFALDLAASSPGPVRKLAGHDSDEAAMRAYASWLWAEDRDSPEDPVYDDRSDDAGPGA
jgi:hypothetical protein